MKNLFVLTGPDACGKDTQIEWLQKNLQGKGRKVQTLSIQTSLREFILDVEEKDIYSVLSVFLNKFNPVARTLFLQSLIMNAFNHLDENSDVVLFNGYWYKYAASEKCYGIDPELWVTFARDQLPVPHKVIYIDVEPNTCLKRRTHWTTYEQGLSPYSKTPALEFFDFQKQMHRNLKTLMKERVPDFSTINGNESVDHIAMAIQKTLGISSSLPLEFEL